MSASIFDLAPPEAEPLRYKWCPSAELEDTTPTLADSPNGWIIRTADGRLTLGTFDWDEDVLIPGEPLFDGQIVEFSGCRIFGGVSISKAEDGSFTVEPEADDRATHFAAEFDDVFDSIEEAVAAGVDDVLTYRWITQRCRFDEACGQFVAVAASEAPSC